MNQLSVYYIGDDGMLTPLYSYILRQDQYIVESTTNLTRGLEHCRSKAPDLLVLEHTTPQTGLTSVVIYQHLRSAPTTIGLPILVIRCERQVARQEYTTQPDSKLVFLPIVFTVEEFLAAVEGLIKV